MQHLKEVNTMKELNVREMREAIGRLDTLVEDAGELIVTRRGKPIARILPATRRVPRPDHAELRARMPHLGIPSDQQPHRGRDALLARAAQTHGRDR